LKIKSKYGEGDEKISKTTIEGEGEAWGGVTFERAQGSTAI